MPSKVLPRILGKSKVDFHSALDGLREELRHVCIDAESLERLHVEELGADALPGTGADELAGIDLARGYYAVEGRIDFLERLHFKQALEVGLRRLDGGCRGGGLVDESVGVLLRDGVGFDEVRVALGLGVRIVGVGLGSGQVGLSLDDLFVQFGRGDDGQQLALFHFGADVGVPVVEIAVGPGVDRRISISGYVSGKHELL